MAVVAVADGESLEVVCLGTGTSHGVPMIACDCPVCTSDDPRDRRSRTSVAVRFDGGTLLIDTSQELRLQSIACRIDRVDAVLYTHFHADHVAGLDDLRRFNWLQKCVLPLYAEPETAGVLRRMYPYAFEDDPTYPSAAPKLTIHEIDESSFELLGREIVPIRLMHGPLPILGYRIGNFAYCTDCSFIPDASVEKLQGLDVLILDALRHTPHPTHFTLAQAVETARRINAKRTCFTHIAHELKHAETNADLPDGMALAHDGLVLRLPFAN